MGGLCIGGHAAPLGVGAAGLPNCGGSAVYPGGGALCLVWVLVLVLALGIIGDGDESAADNCGPPCDKADCCVLVSWLGVGCWVGCCAQGGTLAWSGAKTWLIRSAGVGRAVPIAGGFDLCTSSSTACGGSGKC